MTRLPYALQEAIVQACGTVFYWKQPLKAILARAGVSRSLIDKYEHERKFIMVRSILAELDERGEAGVRVQQQLVSELAAMPDVHDSDNRAAGLKALADLRKVAKQEGLVDDDRKAREDAERRKKAADERYTALAARRRGLGELHNNYTELAMNAENPQGRGFDLQDVLQGLFRLHDLLYHPPFRKGTVEETDGFFSFEGFQYLVEARWRKKQPPIGDLRAFSSKVRAKIESTRGLFLSIPGFRPEVVEEARPLANLILMDGQELALVLEGQMSLIEALRLKIEKAAKQGVLYYSIAHR